MAKRGTQEDEQPDTTIVVDLEKYSIPDGTRYIRGITFGHVNFLYLDPCHAVDMVLVNLPIVN